jgi:glutathione synthase/RimK-type ligase-like ATP-grasp enzyme
VHVLPRVRAGDVASLPQLLGRAGAPPAAKVNVAFVTHAARADLTPDDALAADALRGRGVAVEAAPWDATADWRRFDAVVIRSTWDYHRRIGEFLRWVDAIEATRVPLWNPPALVRWNHDKRYLDDLAAAGVTVAPTVRVARGAACDLSALLDARGWREAVIKPPVSATAHRTWACTRVEAGAKQRDLDSMLRDGDVLVQLLIPEIRTAGEWSLVFFAGAFSHAVVKRPRAGDFRSQHDFGGSVEPRTPPPSLVAEAQHVLASVRDPWLYARVDGIESRGRFVLVELELIEPVLHFAADPASPTRFADALSSTR